MIMSMTFFTLTGTSLAIWMLIRNRQREMAAHSKEGLRVHNSNLLGGQASAVSWSTSAAANRMLFGSVLLYLFTQSPVRWPAFEVHAYEWCRSYQHSDHILMMPFRNVNKLILSRNLPKKATKYEWVLERNELSIWVLMVVNMLLTETCPFYFQLRFECSYQLVLKWSTYQGQLGALTKRRGAGRRGSIPPAHGQWKVLFIFSILYCHVSINFYPLRKDKKDDLQSLRIGIPEKGALARASGTLDRKFGNNLLNT